MIDLKVEHYDVYQSSVYKIYNEFAIDENIMVKLYK